MNKVEVASSKSGITGLIRTGTKCTAVADGGIVTEPVLACISEGDKVVSLNEVSSLVQRLRKIMKDSNEDVFGVDISTRHSRVHMWPIAFLVEFVDFDIVIRGSTEYPYELTSTIGGVTFFTVMSAEDVVDLKTTIPDQFNYITSKVQVEGV